MNETAIIEFFSNYTYEPLTVYFFIIMFMTASSFGLPIPEEVTLISAGLVGHMAMNPGQYPPPSPDAHGVVLWVLCFVCFFAVLGSDLFIFIMGKYFGKRLIHTKLLGNKKAQHQFTRINKLFDKYGHWACGIFRFTPGVRFPGHLSCGIMGVPLWKFLLIDGTAALISVPTQVYFVAHYGEQILDKVRQFKMILFVTIVSLLVVWLIYKLYKLIRDKRNQIA